MGAGASVAPDEPDVSLQSFRFLKNEYASLVQQHVSDEAVFEHMKKVVLPRWIRFDASHN